jgi:murein L,D-transpeptidase YcbB/YkuD
MLGAVKFLFPNDHNVYMHDTPARGLFEQPIRAYSHGCIRVHEPMKLAALLLKRDREWAESRVEKFIEEQVELATEQWIGLRQKIPVHLEYVGAGVSEKGEIAFFGDIYRLDREALAAKEAVFAAAIAAAKAKGAGTTAADGAGSGDGSGNGDGSGSGERTGSGR